MRPRFWHSQGRAAPDLPSSSTTQPRPSHSGQTALEISASGMRES